MREFFQGWRRKVGIVTLLMACVSVMAWVKSRAYQDEIYVRIDKHVIYCVQTFDFGVCLWRYRLLEESMSPDRFSWTSQRHFRGSEEFLDLLPLRSLLGIRYASDKIRSDQYHVLIIPYWLITGPLTLLSAYLILWQPRKRVVVDQQRSDH